jgi:hypothetical protein
VVDGAPDVDLAAIEQHCADLAARLDRRPDWQGLRAVYLELAPMMGQLQGAVGSARRQHGDGAAGAEAALDGFKTGVRAVGLDIRLASESSLALGLQTALQQARETLAALRSIDEDTE